MNAETAKTQLIFTMTWLKNLIFEPKDGGIGFFSPDKIKEPNMRSAIELFQMAMIEYEKAVLLNGGTKNDLELAEEETVPYMSSVMLLAEAMVHLNENQLEYLLQDVKKRVNQVKRIK